MSGHLRILSRLYNTPLAISQEKLDIISSNVTLKIITGEHIERGVATPTEKEVDVTNPAVAVINVFDMLVSKGGAGESGFTSYQGIRALTIAAIEAGATKIGFYVDGPGGEFAGLFGLTSFINTLPSMYGVETFSFTDGNANSASYAILSSTQKIYATESAIVGSIAAIMDLVDVTKLDAKEGITHHILRSKSEKDLGNPHEEFTPEILEKFTVMLDKADVLFNNEVVKNRPMLTVDSIKSMKGDTFIASDALELGLIDAIVANVDEVMIAETTKIPLNNITGANMPLTLEEVNSKLAATEAEIVTLKAKGLELATNASAATGLAITEERVRCMDILQAGETLKISAAQVQKRISTGTSKNDTVDIFTAIAEANGNATSINTDTGAAGVITPTPEASAKLNVVGIEASVTDILAAAKEQAGDK